MTYELVCSKCGYTLYSGFDLRAPNDILKSFGSRCKKCGTRLVTDSFKLEVKKLEGPVT